MKKRDNSNRVLFERGSTLATGLSVAFLLGAADQSQKTELQDLLRVESQWETTTPTPTTHIADHGGETSKLEIRVPSEDIRWTEADDKRFHELAVAEAVGELSQEEAGELGQLTALRRAYQNPRTGEEVLWEYHQRLRMTDLIESLNRYVRFYEAPDPAWKAARESS
jgi:hypothetical protein